MATLRLKKKSTTLRLKRKSIKTKSLKIPLPVAKQSKTPKKPIPTKKKKKPAPPKKQKEPIVEVESKISKKNRLTKELNLFPVWVNMQPLEVGILADFLKRFYPVFSKKIIRLVMNDHTSCAEYLEKVVKGDNRFNLDGDITSEIQEKERIYSKRKWKAKLEKPLP
jgi:hypothetical protein